MTLCLQPSAPRWNFMRLWHCSLPEGHEPPHRAYENHDVAGGAEKLAWVGPWEDGSPHPGVEEALAEERAR